MQVIIQVVLNVPEGSGKELTGEQYEVLVDNALNQMTDDATLPGVAYVTSTFEDCV